MLNKMPKLKLSGSSTPKAAPEKKNIPSLFLEGSSHLLKIRKNNNYEVSKWFLACGKGTWPVQAFKTSKGGTHEMYLGPATGAVETDVLEQVESS